MSRIIRTNAPTDRFAVISNAFLRDNSLSLRARGLGAWMLSHSTGWETSVSAIVKQAGSTKRRGEGRDGIAVALAELEAAGYLRRVQSRDARGVMGSTDYEIQCEPFPGEMRTSEPLTAEPLTADPNPAEPTHKKTSSSKKINNPKKTTPSGGAAAAAPEAENVEDAVKTRTKQPEPAGLFEVEKPPAPEPHGAAAVVASYVVAYRKAHGETDPVKSHKGRVARDAKQILGSGQATEAELVQVAARLGAGDFASLGTELARFRRTSGKPSRPGMAHAAPNDDPRWAAYSEPVLTDWSEDEELAFQDYLARNGG